LASSEGLSLVLVKSGYSDLFQGSFEFEDLGEEEEQMSAVPTIVELVEVKSLPFWLIY
jgi:hypothetical protein